MKTPDSANLPGTSVHEWVMPSGLRVYHQHIPSTRAMHAGFIVNAGTRHERPGERGMAHFIEHMIFKGTKRRKTWHILNHVESAGGELNAYTTKEKTCIYASLEAGELDRALDVLGDIVFHPVFPSREIIKEKQVISDEIDMYRDNPEEAIFEDFDRMVFPGSALGHPILGTRRSITAFTQEKLRAFHKRHYSPANMVLSLAGNADAETVKRKVDEYFSRLRPAPVPRHGKLSLKKGPRMQETEISGTQAHCVVGGRAYPLQKGKYVALHLLVNYLGGAAGNSRLNMAIRERHGLSYNIYSFYQPYVEDGMWGVYFSCDPKNRERIHALVQSELDALRSKKPGPVMLAKIKRQAAGQLVLSNEYPQTLMLSAGKNILDFGRNLALPEMLQLVDSVTERDLQQAANEIFAPSRQQFLSYIPA